MSKLLAYLRTILNISGSKAMPNYAESAGTDLTFSDAGKRIVAPYNGYLAIRVNSAIEDFRIAFNVNDKMIFSAYGPFANINVAATFPVRKGDSITYGVAGSGDFNSIIPTIYKIMGGGKNFIKELSAFVQGGTLCLKNFLPWHLKLFALTFLQLKQEGCNSRYRLEKMKATTLLRIMDKSNLLAIVSSLNSEITRAVNHFLSQMRQKSLFITRMLLCLFARVIRFFGDYPVIRKDITRICTSITAFLANPSNGYKEVRYE